jgi:hypothetical protein
MFARPQTEPRSESLLNDKPPAALTGFSGLPAAVFVQLVLCLDDARSDEEDQLLIVRGNGATLEQVA